MNNQLTLNGLYLEERHPVDDALGCMIPTSILASGFVTIVILLGRMLMG